MSAPFPKKGGTATASRPAAAVGIDTAAADGDVKTGKPVGDPFSTPPGASEFKISDFLGELVLVTPTEVIEEMVTEVGTTDAIRADVVPLTGEHANETCEDMLVFQLALKRALRKTIDGPNPYLLGRLTKGTAKAGKSAPYLFAQPSEDDMVLARKFLGIA